jgi:hypothetical protein
VVVVVFAVFLSGIRLLRRQYRSLQESTIHQMLVSSRAHESEGRFDQALVDLDAALDIIRRTGESTEFPLEKERQHRVELARREAQATLERLVQHRRDPYPLGDWLNLMARSKKDPDISTLRPEIEGAFRVSVRRQSTTELEAARWDFDAGRAIASLRACERIALLLPHLATEVRAEVRGATEELVERLVVTRGVALETPRGDFVVGSDESYRAHLLPVLIKALEAKGYLPYRESSPWKAAWQKASYHMRLEVSERHERNYLSTENRLTRIEARLTLSSAFKVVWETMPTAQTTVPLHGLPAYLSSRLAVSPRSEEVERLLYEDARGQIEGKFSQALGHMPACCL